MAKSQRHAICVVQAFMRIDKFLIYLEFDIFLFIPIIIFSLYFYVSNGSLINEKLMEEFVTITESSEGKKIHPV